MSWGSNISAFGSFAPPFKAAVAAGEKRVNEQLARPGWTESDMRVKMTYQGLRESRRSLLLIMKMQGSRNLSHGNQERADWAELNWARRIALLTRPTSTERNAAKVFPPARARRTRAHAARAPPPLRSAQLR